MDLIIKTRLEALKNNLVKIQGILESVKDRRAEIDELSTELKQAQELLGDVGTNVTFVLDTSQNTWAKKPIDKSFTKYLNIAKKSLIDLEHKLERAEQRVKAIQTRRTPIERSFEATVKNDLNEKMNPWFEIINDHLESLKNAKPGEADALMEKAWDDYTEIMSKKNELIFSEYVEFLAGLALRDAGLDEGICRIADELMRSCGSVGSMRWSALTIPASKEASTLARSIRLRFPEWTIWAVPLTAHELGQVVIREPGRPDFEKYVRSEIPNTAKVKQQHMRILLADAFATYVMGPAYACSVILLRFNPADDGKGMYPSDTKRAYVVLSMLKKMYERNRILNPPYGELLDKLKKAWDAALRIGHAKPAETPSNADEELFDRWVTHVLGELSEAYATGLYEGRLWQSTQDALALLLKGDDPGDKLEGREEWRDVLNAAWAYRVNNVDESSQQIARKAEELWQRIVQKKSETQERQVSPSGVTINRVPRIRTYKKS